MADLQDEFILDEEMTYLNHAAVAPWPRSTRDAVIAFAEENARVGSRNYLQWVETEHQLRGLLASLVNAPAADDIALLKNTSEALSVVAHGLVWKAGDNVVISDQEFPSNRIVWESLRDQGVEIRQVDLAHGDTPEQSLIQACDHHTRLLAISSVQYGTGLKMDLLTLGNFCKHQQILFCVDAIQSIGAVQFDVQAIHADFVMADGHKWMLGPEGLALFYVKPARRAQLKLHQYGWHMVENHLDFNHRDWQIAHSARRFECGSPNMLAVHALHASIELLLQAGMKKVEQAVVENARYIIDKVTHSQTMELITANKPERLAGIVTFRHKTIDAENLYQYLMDNNVMCACRAGGIRFSPHFYTRKTDIDRAFAYIESFQSQGH